MTSAAKPGPLSSSQPFRVVLVSASSHHEDLLTALCQALPCPTILKSYRKGSPPSLRPCDLIVLEGSLPPEWQEFSRTVPVFAIDSADEAPDPSVRNLDTADPFEMYWVIREQLFGPQEYSILTGPPRPSGAIALAEKNEEDRRRIAKVLHGTTGQNLVALHLALSAALKEPELPRVREILQDSIATIDAAIDQIRQISHSLRPSILDDLGLIPALRSLARHSGSEVEFRSSVQPPELKPHIENALFRIAQDVLTVSSKREQPATIWLNEVGSSVHLCISFPAPFENPADRLNILAIEERTLLAGGRSRILRSAQTGKVEVHASFPLCLAEDPVDEQE